MVCFLADANRFILIWKGTLRGACVHAKSIQLSPTLCDPADCSQPGSSIHGILQARILEWVVMPPPRDLPNPGIEPTSPVSPALQADALPLNHQGSPHWGVSLLNRQDLMVTPAASAVRFLCERAVRIYCKTIGIREVTKKVNDLIRRVGVCIPGYLCSQGQVNHPVQIRRRCPGDSISGSRWRGKEGKGCFSTTKFSWLRQRFSESL